MCSGCLERYEASSALPPTMDMLDAAMLIRDLYAQPGGAAGGPLHCLLDDFNCEDQFLEMWKDWTGPEETRALAWRIIRRLRPFTEAQRAAAIGIAHGYIDLETDRIIT